MNNLDAAAIAVLASVVTGLATAFVAWRNGHHENKVDENTTLFDAYHDVVANLQSEIARLQSELGLIRAEMHKCEQSNKKLSLEIRKLQTCVDKLNRAESDISAALSIEHQPDEAE